MISDSLLVPATSSHSTDHHSLDATVVIAPSCPTMYCFSRCSNRNLRLSSASFLNCISLNYKDKNSYGKTFPTFPGTYIPIQGHKVCHLRNGTFSQGFSKLTAVVQAPFSPLGPAPLKILLNPRGQHIFLGLPDPEDDSTT